MPGRSTPLSNYPVVRSSDPALVRDRLFRVYGANSFDVKRTDGELAVTADHLQIGGVGLSYVEYIGDVSVGFGEVSFVRQCFSIEGAARYHAGKRSTEIAPGTWTPILHGRQPLRFDFQSGYRQIALRIEFDTLLRNLSTPARRRMSANLSFDEALTNQSAMEALRRRVFHLAIDYNERGAFFSDLAAAEVERMIVMKFLICHRHNYTHLLLREPPPASSTAVKTVEEFIEANWDKPIDIDAMVGRSAGQRAKPVPAIQAGPGLLARGFRQAGAAQPCAGNARAVQRSRLGHTGRPEMRVSRIPAISRATIATHSASCLR